MKEKFKEYLAEIGLRYAVHYGKYMDIPLAVLQLWHSDKSEQTQNDIRRYYNECC